MTVGAKNIFPPKVDGLEQKLKAPPIGSKKMPKSAKLPMTQHSPPPPESPDGTFGGGGARTRLLRRQTVRESWGESSHMRAGGATEAIWDGSARHFRETERTYRRCRTLLMYRPAPTWGGYPLPHPQTWRLELLLVLQLSPEG